MTQPFVRNRATWLIYLMLAFYGYILNIFGPITPFLKNELNLSYTVSSFHFSAFALGIIVAGLIGHRVIQKFGRWHSLWMSAFGTGVGALLLIAGRDPVVTIGASFVMGLISSLILALVPSVLSDEHGPLLPKALSEAGVVASLLSVSAPVLVGWFAATEFGWRMALIIGAASALVMRIGFNRAKLPEVPVSTSADQPRRPLPALYWVYWTALVVAVSVEFCMVFWSADYLETGLGMPKASAAQAVSLFLAGMILGRLLASRLVQRFATQTVITGSLVIAAVGFLIYWMATTPLVSVVGLFFTGLGVSCLYPLILSLAIGAAADNIDRASAYGSLASGVAIFALPLLLGRLADAAGIRAAYIIVIVLIAIALLIILGTTRRTSARGTQRI